jgi:predicted DsbA family dithiol-disulfide isomerase
MRLSSMMVVMFAVGLWILSGCSSEESATEAAKPDTAGAKAADAKTATPDAKATPEARPVPVVALGDERCTDPSCNTKRPLNSLKAMIPGLQVTELDWSSPEGKAAYADHGLRLLPAFIFDEALQGEEQALKRLARSLKPSAKDGFQVLQMRATHDPTREICDNGADDTGNGKADCDDDDCKAALTCRPEIKGDLQVFVMSQCSFGVKALDAMQEVLEAFGKEIEFDVHFIASESGDGFQSLHGQPEVDENIRELCARKLAPKNYKWMEYVWCRDKDIRSTAFESCLGAAGLKAAAFNACASGEEGKQLLRDDLKLAQSLGIGASPSWLVNNKVQFSGLDPKAIQAGICQANPKFEGCKATLSGSAPGRGGGGGCGCGGGGGGGGGSCGG